MRVRYHGSLIEHRGKVFDAEPCKCNEIDYPWDFGICRDRWMLTSPDWPTTRALWHTRRESFAPLEEGEE